MKIAGLTGNIGAGKSTVAQVFCELGFPVFEADAESKKILESDSSLHLQLKQQFGEEIFTENIPDRKKMAALVFTDQEKLHQLNSLLHPLVQKRFATWCSEQKTEWVIKEAAILIESGTYKNCNKIILVTCPEDIRIERVMKRDSVSRTQVEARIKNQMSEEEKKKMADFVIVNDGDHLLIPQISIILEKLNENTQRQTT
ncbi:MAG: dephospho-CoA kinase [Bacteroidota bacterium]